MTSYFNIKKLRRQSKQHDPHEAAAAQDQTLHSPPPAPAISTPSAEPASSPLLDDEDERFLQRLAAIAQEPEGTPPPLPTRPSAILDGGDKIGGKNAQEAIMDGADKVPLPTSPPAVTMEETVKGKEKAVEGGLGRKKSVMSYFNRFTKSGSKTPDKDKKKGKAPDKDKLKMADDLQAVAEASKTSDRKEAEKEQQDLAEILDQLNLSAVNNRVFSFSKESEELLDKFKLVLKDLVNGVPTAYNDLEKLLTDSEGQLKKMYGSLPPFLQNLIKSLPTKITAALGPELMAAQAEKPGFDAKMKATASGSGTKSKRPKIPSLKQLVTAQGAVATMLKSILNFLKLRFPFLLTGTNVLLSLAVFILLFVFWYCHKRGRETRLEKERLATEEGGSALASSASSFTDDGDFLLDAKHKTEAESSRERAEPPLIIGDDKESDQPTASLADMPSVAHLPDPGTVPARGSKPVKEAPLQTERK